MNKYSNRSLPVITRDSYNENGSSDAWLSEFARHLEKNSVQPKSTANSLYDQMSSIIRGNKPKYPSVDAAVNDMRERTGLLAYQNQLKAYKEQSGKSKVAQQKEIEVELFKQNPNIKNSIDNYIRDTRGNMLIPEIVHHIKAMHKSDVPDATVWGSPALLTYINTKNTEEKKQHPSTDQFNDLGHINYTDDDIDPSNTDALHILNPATSK